MISITKREEIAKHTGFHQKKNKPRIKSYHRIRKFVVNIYGKNFTLDLIPVPAGVGARSCATLTSKQIESNYESFSGTVKPYFTGDTRFQLEKIFKVARTYSYVSEIAE